MNQNMSVEPSRAERPDPTAQPQAKAKRPRKPRANHHNAYGILNPYGDVWTPDWFDTPEAAMAYVRRFWAGCSSTVDVSRFLVVPVEVRVRAIGEPLPTTEQSPIDMEGRG